MLVKPYCFGWVYASRMCSEFCNPNRTELIQLSLSVRYAVEKEYNVKYMVITTAETYG